MERMTRTYPDGGIALNCSENKAISRLAAYEDTGLTPEECATVAESYPRLFRDMERLTEYRNGEPRPKWLSFSQIEIRKIVKKLAYYEDAEEQGRLLLIPCKVGDTLWQRGAAKGTIGSFKVPDVYWIIENANKIGETVFLTREEAEAALAKMKEGNNG